MTYKISAIDPTEFKEVVDVWEASVRATHDFLSEEDILFFKPRILKEYLFSVELRAIRDEQGKILGFSGVAEGNLEMLFIDPDFRGKGIGQALVDYAIQELHVVEVDVNEQNEQAVGFYEHCGFRTFKRTDVDGYGKPYPVLYMQLMK